MTDLAGDFLLFRVAEEKMRKFYKNYPLYGGDDTESSFRRFRRNEFLGRGCSLVPPELLFLQMQV